MRVYVQALNGKDEMSTSMFPKFCCKFISSTKQRKQCVRACWVIY